jgi:hypothetical protein
MAEGPISGSPSAAQKIAAIWRWFTPAAAMAAYPYDQIDQA